MLITGLDRRHDLVGVARDGFRGFLEDRLLAIRLRLFGHLGRDVLATRHSQCQ